MQTWKLVVRIKVPTLLFIACVKLGMLLPFLSFCLFYKVEIMRRRRKRKTEYLTGWL